MIAPASTENTDIPRNAHSGSSSKESKRTSKPSTGKSLEVPNSANTKSLTSAKPTKTVTIPSTPVTPSTPATPGSKASLTAPQSRPRSNSTLKPSSPGVRSRLKSNTFSGGNRPSSKSDDCEDSELKSTPYSIELVEGPLYLENTVIPPVLQAIHDLMFLIKFGTIVPDPIHFIALKLKPSLAIPKAIPVRHSIQKHSIHDGKVTTVHEIIAEASAAELGAEVAPNGVLDDEERQRTSMSELEFEGLSEKEIKVKLLFKGEFY